MGHTAYALAALLTAFLGGLAIGSYLGGQLVDRRNVSARTYAVVEVLVAITALSVPLAFRMTTPLFGMIHRAFVDTPIVHGLVQFGACSFVLAVPTILMGMTLPMVVSIVSPSDRTMTVGVGRLYALNSFGGVMGAAIAGLLLLPSIGESKTGLIAATLNVLAAVFAFISSFDDEPVTAATPPTSSVRADAWRAPSRNALIILYGVAGFTALALQVGWSRLVGLSVGSTIYGFTITLVTFITGLTLGSGWLVRWTPIRRDPVRALFVLHAVIGAWTVLSLPWLGGLPDRVAGLMARDLGFMTLWSWQLGLVFTTIVVPTLAMGAAFPLVAELLRRDASSGRATGLAYSANTVGNIIGSMAAGFLLISWFGMRGTIVVSALTSGAIALAYLAVAKRKTPRTAILPAVVTMVVVVGGSFLAPAWEQDALANAPFLRDQRITAKRASLLGPVIDYVEGPTTVAAVRASDRGRLSLYVGGVSEAASTSPLHTYLAHLGMMMHPAPKHALVVGLGAGNTLAAVLRHPVEHVDVVELSSEVVTMARRHFLSQTERALEDPRVELVVGDGRSHLRHARRTYDVVVSQPSYPWAGGAARLFTQEYFEEIRSNLKPDGLCVLWLPVQFEGGASSLLTTFRTVFPNAAVFTPQPNFRFYLVVGFGSEHGGVDWRAVARAFERPGVGASARGAGVHSVAGLAKWQIEWPTEVGRLNTDDNGYVEYESFRALLGR